MNIPATGASNSDRGVRAMSAMLNEDYVTVAEAATLLQVSQSTLWRWIDQGDVPAYRVGQRRVRLKREDLSRLISPARQGQGKGAQMAQAERQRLGPLTRKEQKQLLEAVEAARRMQAEQLKARGGKPFSPSYALLDDLRDQRGRDLS